MLPPPDPNAPRFFLDSSVILAGSASVFGASHALLILGELGLIRLVTIPYVFNEVERNLALKLARAVPRYQQIRAAINWEIIDNPSFEEVEKWTALLPAKDAPVLAAAAATAADRLITLDIKHFIDPAGVARASGLVIAAPREVVGDVRSALSRYFRKTTE